MNLISLKMFIFLVVFLINFNLLMGQQEEDNSILDYRPPKWAKEEFPYYFVGHDKEGSPVWASQYGQWDVRSVVEEGGKKLRSFDKYIEQGFERVTRTDIFRKSGNTQNLVIGILDLEGYSSHQLFHFPTTQKSLGYVIQLLSIMRKNGSDLKRGFLINCNWYFRTFWRMVRPLLGEVAQRVELYGFNREVWEPRIRSYVNSDQLPHWAGGDAEGYKPIKIYG